MWKDEWVKRREREREDCGRTPRQMCGCETPLHPPHTHTLPQTTRPTSPTAPADLRATQCFPLKTNSQKREGTLQCLTLFYCKANYRQRICQRPGPQRCVFVGGKYIKDKKKKIKEAEERVEGGGGVETAALMRADSRQLPTPQSDLYFHCPPSCSVKCYGLTESLRSFSAGGVAPRAAASRGRGSMRTLLSSGEPAFLFYHNTAESVRRGLWP